MKTRTIFLTILLIAISSWAFSLDWVAIHNQADGLNPEEISSGTSYRQDSIEYNYLLALANLNLYRSEEALKYFKMVAEEDNNSIEAKWGEAEVLRRQHKLDESEKLLDSIIKENPKFAPALITLAYIRYLKMDFAKAAGYAHQVTELGAKNVDKPNFVRAYGLYAASKGMMAHYGGMIAKISNGYAVIKHLSQARNIDPDSPTVNFGFGAYYMLIPKLLGRDLDKAEEFLNKAIAKDPLFPDPYVRLAQIYKERKDEAKYEFYLNKALELDPQNELALDAKTGACKFICVPYKGQDAK